jgi:DNA-binding MarR family transcriptional regulator
VKKVRVKRRPLVASAKTSSPITPLTGAASPWKHPGEHGENLRPVDFPTFFLGRLTGIVKRSVMPAYTERFGLTTPEWRVFAAIALQATSFNDVCSFLTMDRGQVSRTVPQLAAKGLVEQLRIRRPGPRRRGEGEFQTQLAMTNAGRALFRQALPIARQHQMILLRALNETERTSFYGAMLKVIAAAEQFEEFQTMHANPRRLPVRPPQGKKKSGASIRPAEQKSERQLGR